MDPLLVTLIAVFLSSLGALFGAFFNRKTSIVCAGLTAVGVCFFNLLVGSHSVNDRWSLSRFMFAYGRPSLESGLLFASFSISIAAIVLPWRRNNKPRWYLFSVVCIMTSIVLYYAIDDSLKSWLGETKSLKLLKGDQESQIESFQITNNQRRVVCTDPEVLRDIEDRWRKHTRERRETGLYYRLTVHFRGGGSHTFSTYWDQSSVAMEPEGGDGRVPYTISLAHPISVGLKEIVSFLFSDLGKSAGTVMVLDAHEIRYEKDETVR
jgi:hypothetical protein